MKLARLALLAALVCAPALAQVPPDAGTVTLTAAPTSGSASSVPVTLTWSTTASPDGTAATSCTGSWTAGALSTSGTATVTATKSTTYTLTCTWNDLNIVLTWTAPTMNTDGSALASNQLPLSYTVNAGASGQEMPFKAGITALTYTYSMTAPGTECFTLTAFDALGNFSVPTNEICATTGPATASASASFTMSTRPNPPGNFTAK